MVARDQQLDRTLHTMTTTKSLGGSPVQPDGFLRGQDGRLLAKWEVKAASLEEAVGDLHKKMAAWTPLYYGE